MNRESLKAAGYIEVAPGEWRKPSKPHPLARLPDSQPQQNPVSANAGAVCGQARRAGGVAGGVLSPQLCITITSLRKKMLDSDNLSGGAKSLRDAIAVSLNLDDADSVIEWKYQQLVTQGPVGTLVQIETI